jgi:hypothetical protein
MNIELKIGGVMKNLSLLLLVLISSSTSPIFCQINCHANFCYEAHWDLNNHLCVTTFDLSSSNDSITTYSWTGPCSYSGLQKNLTNVCFPQACAGSLTLTIVTADGCINSKTKLIIADSTCDSLLLGVMSESISNPLVYYSPVSNSIIIRNLTTANPKRFFLFDLLGREAFPDQTIDRPAEINVLNLPKGVYFYKITDEKNIITDGKLMIIK